LDAHDASETAARRDFGFPARKPISPAIDGPNCAFEQVRRIANEMPDCDCRSCGEPRSVANQCSSPGVQAPAGVIGGEQKVASQANVMISVLGACAVERDSPGGQRVRKADHGIRSRNFRRPWYCRLYGEKIAGEKGMYRQE
jgi:hypothetical protein